MADSLFAKESRGTEEEEEEKGLRNFQESSFWSDFSLCHTALFLHTFLPRSILFCTFATTSVCGLFNRIRQDGKLDQKSIAIDDCC